MKLKNTWNKFKNFSEEKFEEFCEQKSKKITSFFSRLKRQPKEDKKLIVPQGQQLQQTQQPQLEGGSVIDKKLLPGNHPEGKAIMWTRVLYGIVILLAIAGYFLLGSIGFVALPIFVYLINFMITGWINKPLEYGAIERMGQFRKIVDSGLKDRVVLGDSVVPDPFGQLPPNRTLTTRRREIYLYTEAYRDDKEIKNHLHFEVAKMDFQDVFGVDVKIAFFGGIGKEEGSSQEELYNNIYNFLYRYRNAPSKIVLAMDTFTRATLQKKSLGEANLIGMNVWEIADKKAKEKAKSEVNENGWFLEENPLFLVDLVVPIKAEQASHDAYTQGKVGEGEADRIKKGFFGPVKDMILPKSKGGLGLNSHKAMEYFLKNKAFDVLEKIPNPTLFLGEGDISKVLDISKSSTKEDKIVKK